MSRFEVAVPILRTMSYYDTLVAELKQIALLGSVGSVLGWDEQTYMPPRAAEHRANQGALLAGMVHERFTSTKVGELLGRAAEEVKGEPADSIKAANVRETLRGYDRQKKLPPTLVEELSKTSTLGQQAWGAAKKTNDWPAFKPWLEKMMHLKRQEIAAYGYTTEPYDALLEDYEPGETAANLRKVFENLRGPLVELVGKIASSGKVAPLEILERHYPKAQQESFSREAAEAVGFDFRAGRLDVTVHPFCTDLGPGDVRMTTRYDESFFGDAFFSVLHETGHALYEQGLPHEHFGTPAGQAISLGIHESQSRMWENMVGRSGAFWQHWLPKARQAFGATLQGVGDKDWLFAINDVRPSFIRTEADEMTYNLHVLIRFELETALLSDQLSVADLPGAWNEKYKKYLGLTVPDFARGCMQDVHWSAGLVAYFPTYTLGNLAAAQFFAKAQQDLGDLHGMFAKGEYQPLLQWLRKNIHSVGRRYTAPQLIQKVTGKPLSSESLVRYLNGKASEFYGV